MDQSDSDADYSVYILNALNRIVDAIEALAKANYDLPWTKKVIGPMAELLIADSPIDEESFYANLESALGRLEAAWESSQDSKKHLARWFSASGLIHVNIWRLGEISLETMTEDILSGIGLGEIFMALKICTGAEPRMGVLPIEFHREISGQGGKVKAERAVRERARVLKSIQPLFRELRKVRLSGKYKTCEEAITSILTNDDRFTDIASIIYSDPPVLSYDHTFMPEAKKVWREAVKPTPSKKPPKKTNK
jgi:hypothetical protein